MFATTSTFTFKLGSAMNVRPLSSLTSLSSRDSSASTIRSLAARISRLGTPPLFPADFFTKTIHLLSFSQVIRHAVPAAKPYCALVVGADVIIVGQEAPPSYSRAAIHLCQKVPRLSSLSHEGPYCGDGSRMIVD